MLANTNMSGKYCDIMPVRDLAAEFNPTAAPIMYTPVPIRAAVGHTHMHTTMQCTCMQHAHKHARGDMSTAQRAQVEYCLDQDQSCNFWANTLNQVRTMHMHIMCTSTCVREHTCTCTSITCTWIWIHMIDMRQCIGTDGSSGRVRYLCPRSCNLCAIQSPPVNGRRLLQDCTDISTECPVWKVPGHNYVMPCVKGTPVSKVFCSNV